MKFLVLSILLIFCATAATTPAAARQSETVKVQLKKSKLAPKGRVTIRFVEVLEDSRCPENTRCIWAGVARIKIEVRKNGKPAKTFELNTNQLDKTAVYEGCEIKLINVAPYPKTSTPIPQSTYSATFSITKSRNRER